MGVITQDAVGKRIGGEGITLYQITSMGIR